MARLTVHSLAVAVAGDLPSSWMRRKVRSDHAAQRIRNGNEACEVLECGQRRFRTFVRQHTEPHVRG